MFLAVDVGNSNILLGVYRNSSWEEVWRIETDKKKGRDDYLNVIGSLFEQAGLAPEAISGAMIASVVPMLTGHLKASLEKLTGIAPLLLTVETDTGIILKTDNPKEIGPDLIAGAAGGYHKLKESCIVIDFGTATTLMVVEDPGVMSGGIICAGLKITVDALVNKTSLLGDIPIEAPESILGRDTIGAMQSGLVLGHVCMVEGLVGRIKEKVGKIKVLATGGLAETLAPHTECFDFVEPLLTLEGMRIIAERDHR